MNKVYRVVYNQVTKTWQAVAEFAKSRSKSASSAEISGAHAGARGRFSLNTVFKSVLVAAALSAAGTAAAQNAPVSEPFTISDQAGRSVAVTADQVIAQDDNANRGANLSSNGVAVGDPNARNVALLASDSLSLVDKDFNQAGYLPTGVSVISPQGDQAALNAQGVKLESDAGRVELNSRGLGIGTGAEGDDLVSLTQDGLDNGGNRIVNVAAGESDTDAVNVSQLNELAKQTQEIKDAAGNAVQDVTAGDQNIQVRKAGDGSERVVSLNPALSRLSSARFGDNEFDGQSSGVTIDAAAQNNGQPFVSAFKSNQYSEVAPDQIAVGEADPNNFDEDIRSASLTSRELEVLDKENQKAAVVSTDGTAVFDNQNNVASNLTAQGLESRDGNGNVYAQNARGVQLVDVANQKGTIMVAGDTVYVDDANQRQTDVGTDGLLVHDHKNDKLAHYGAADAAFGDADGNGATYDAKGVKLESDAGRVELNGNGLGIGTGAEGDNMVSLTKDGLDNGGNRIQNVAEGQELTDGVNVSQLNAVSDKIDNISQNVIDNLGITKKPDGTAEVNFADHIAFGNSANGTAIYIDKDGTEYGNGVDGTATKVDPQGVKSGDADGNQYAQNARGVQLEDAANQKGTLMVAGDTVYVDVANQRQTEVGTDGLLVHDTLNDQLAHYAADEATFGDGDGNVATYGATGVKTIDNNGNQYAQGAGGVQLDDAANQKGTIMVAGDTVYVDDANQRQTDVGTDGLVVHDYKNDKLAHYGAADAAFGDADGNGATYDAKGVKLESDAGRVELNGNGLGIGTGEEGDSMVSLTKDGLDNGNNRILNVADGVEDSDGVNFGQLRSVNERIDTVSQNVIDNLGITKKPDGTTEVNFADHVGFGKPGNSNATQINKDGATFTHQDGTTTVVNGKGTTITSPSGNSANLSSNGVAFTRPDGSAVSVGQNGIDAGNTVIRNVAPGVAGTDAVNVNQLNANNNRWAQQLQSMGDELSGEISRRDNRNQAGIASAIAAAGLMQAYNPNDKMVSIGGGMYRGEAGYAVGVSTISENGRWGLKATATGDSRNNYGGSASVGYIWR